MKHCQFHHLLAAALLVAGAAPAWSAQQPAPAAQPAPSAQPAPATQPAKPSPAAQPHRRIRSKTALGRAAKAQANVKLVDINHASKDELKQLPGITDALADKIIAGRPYVSKSRLVTQNVLPMAVYEGLHDRIAAVFSGMPKKP